MWVEGSIPINLPPNSTTPHTPPRPRPTFPAKTIRLGADSGTSPEEKHHFCFGGGKRQFQNLEQQKNVRGSNPEGGRIDIMLNLNSFIDFVRTLHVFNNLSLMRFQYEYRNTYLHRSIFQMQPNEWYGVYVPPLRVQSVGLWEVDGMQKLM